MTKKTTKTKTKKTRRAWTAAERAAFAKKMRAAREAAAEDRSNQRGLKTATTKKPSAKKKPRSKKNAPANPPIDPNAWTREPTDRQQYAKGWTGPAPGFGKRDATVLPAR